MLILKTPRRCLIDGKSCLSGLDFVHFSSGFNVSEAILNIELNHVVFSIKRLEVLTSIGLKSRAASMNSKVGLLGSD